VMGANLSDWFVVHLFLDSVEKTSVISSRMFEFVFSDHFWRGAIESKENGEACF
jgi:hypothetical protein